MLMWNWISRACIPWPGCTHSLYVYTKISMVNPVEARGQTRKWSFPFSELRWAYPVKGVRHFNGLPLPPVGEETLMGWGRGLPSDVNENMMDVVYIRPPSFRQGLFSPCCYFGRGNDEGPRLRPSNKFFKVWGVLEHNSGSLPCSPWHSSVDCKTV